MAESDPLFWGSLVVALAVAFVVTVPVNRALIARGQGHAVGHGGAHHAVDPAAVADDPRIASAGVSPGHPHH